MQEGVKSVMLNFLPLGDSLNASRLALGFMDSLWEFFSNPIMIVVYVLTLLIAIIFLIGFVLAGERNRPDPEALQDCIDRINELDELFHQPVVAAAPGEPKEKDSEKEKKEQGPRFYMLSQTDEKAKEWKSPVYNTEIRFEELCERFRASCASRLHLYYDIAFEMI